MEVNKNKKIISWFTRTGSMFLAILTAFVTVLSGGVMTAFADGGSGDGGTGGGYQVHLKGYTYWYDSMPDGKTPAQGWDDASKAWWKTYIEGKLGKKFGLIGGAGAKSYDAIWNESANKALADARARSAKKHARIVGVSSLYTEDGGSDKILPGYTGGAMQYWLAQSGARAGNSSELPENTGWSTIYNNKDGTTGTNWRNWLYDYGIKKATPSAPTLTMVVWAVAEGEPQNDGYLSIKKVSGDTNLSADNKTYSLAGAVYDVFKDAGLKTKAGSITTKANGVSNELKVPKGVYYIKENTPSTGYKVNSNVRKATVEAGKHVTITLDGDMAEPCLHDPIGVLFQKSVEDEDEAGVAPGDVEELGGIKFRVDYYDGYYGSEKEAKAAGEAKASAVFATDDTGYLDFADAKPVDGTSWKFTKGGQNTCPLGTVIITEVGSHKGLISTGYGRVLNIVKDGDTAKPVAKEAWPKAKTDKAVGSYENKIIKGGITITKADYDTHRSEPQGDATLEGVEYQIINNSIAPVVVNGTKYAKGEVVWTGQSKYDSATKTYKVATGSILPYGTYKVVETKPSEGYLNAKWSQDFTIRIQDENHEYQSQASNWNENKVVRGGVAISKVDRETKQYISLGEAHLDGATFDIVNKSKRNVVVGGVEYKPGEVVKTIASRLVDGRYIAQTGDHDLPYGTYEIHETKAGKGYLFDSTSKKESYTFKIREEGKIVDLTQPKDAIEAVNGQAVFDNQVQREDWSFKKKDEDSMERMNKVAFLVTSNTTGESHIIVTDENGTWGSSWNEHTNNTNANDPDSPITNGAIVKDDKGNYIVKDASKLDSEAGTWFTGMPSEMTKWNPDGISYNVNGKNVLVNDSLRSFPYDTYTVKELSSSTNEGHKLVTFTVTLHKYGNADGAGLDIDYGTIDDKVINLKTKLVYDEDGKVMPAAKDTKVNDIITYDNLNDGDYTLKGELHLVNADGKDEGVVAKADKAFTVEGNSTGQESVEFTVDTSEMGGKKLVAFEYLTQNGANVAKHADIKDKDQAVLVPKIGTTLMGDIEHEADASKDVITLTDTVKYENLEVGKSYTMTGKLMDKATGKALVDADGKEVTATTDFVAKDAKGETTVVFEFKGIDVAGKSVVAFESVKQGDIEFAVHTDIDDKDQTVHFPDVKTEAKDKADGDHEAYAGEKQTVVDAVEMHNLTVGKKYKLSGNLHIQNVDAEGKIIDGGILKDKDGKDVVAEKEFTADKSDMTVELEFTFDASELAGKTVVAFETLSRDGKRIGLHADITDESQSVHFPKIGTKLTDSNGSHDVSITEPKAESKDKDEKKSEEKDSDKKASEEKHTIIDIGEDVDEDRMHDFSHLLEKESAESTKKESAESNKDSKNAEMPDAKITSSVANGTKVTLIDHVSYENLIPGTEYVVNGKLHLRDMDKDGKITDGGVLKGKDGKEVTGTVKFKAEKANGTIEVKFEFDAAGLAGKSVVAFEELMKDKQVVAIHTDITDENQTVRIVKIATTAVDSENKTHTLTDSIGKTQKISVVDTIEYTNLKVGQSYTAEGKLHLQKVDKDGKITDGGVAKDKDGKEVFATAEFTPEKPDGSVEVKFEFEIEAGSLDGATLVAFEDVKNGDIVVATHADITDKAQLVNKLKIGTTLTGADKKSKDVQVGDKVDLIDTIAFENLVVGQEYVVKGKLVDGSGNVLKGSDGKEITAESKFTADEATGTTEMKFTVDTSKMKDGDKIVAYEYAYTTDGKLVAHHEDVNDANQTVIVKKDSDTPKTHVDLNTGIENFGLAFAIIMGILTIAAAGTYVYRKRKGMLNA